MKSSPLFLVFLLLCCGTVTAQKTAYTDSLEAFRNRYVHTHEVVTGEDRTHLHFFPVDTSFAVPVVFQPLKDFPWLPMETSGSMKKNYRVVGMLYFKLHDTLCKLRVYQSQNLLNDPRYANYLFLPFMDKTNGDETYENGRYIDLTITDLEKPGFLLDFNKAYNPYCAYVSNKYNCPLPPKENTLSLAIKAGEMKYTGSH